MQKRLNRILINLTDEQLEKLNKLLKGEKYRSRSEAIRDAVLLLLKSEDSPQLQNILTKLKKGEKLIGLSQNDLRKNIIEILRKHSEGLNINQISRISGIHRHTIRKYIADLAREKIVFEKKEGTSRIFFLKGSKGASE